MTDSTRADGTGRMRRAVFGVVMAALGLGVVIAVIKLPAPMVERMLRDDITVDAGLWKRRLMSQLDRGVQTFVSAETSERDDRYLSEITQVSGIYRFKLFSADGRIFWSSRPEDRKTINKKPYFRDVVAQGQIYYRRAEKPIAEIDNAELHIIDPGRAGVARQIVEIYTPVLVDGQFAGAIEFYVDVTETRSAFLRRIRTITIIVAALVLGALFAAIALTLRDGRRRERILRERSTSERKIMQDQIRLAREVRLLGELNEWLQSSRSLNELFGMVGRFMSQVIPDCEGSIYVYANSRDVLIGSAAWSNGTLRDHIHPEDCWGLRRGRTYTYGTGEIDFLCEHVEDFDQRPYFCFPILAHGETVGLMHLRASADLALEKFQATRKLAQMCAEQISMAIANVRMRDQLRDQSIRDPLTGLYNRRHLTESLRQRIEFARREQLHLGLISIDVDHFKKFNDNHGHDAGDMVLRAVGTVLDNACEGDLVACRVGGEEFMVLCPEADGEQAVDFAGMLRREVEKIVVRYGDRALPSITASFGVAIYPVNGQEPQDLMKSSDDALYEAKARGRNTVVLAGARDEAEAETLSIAGDRPGRATAGYPAEVA